MPTERSFVDQHARFLETARALECDEDEAAFNVKLKRIAPPKSKTEKPSGEKP